MKNYIHPSLKEVVPKEVRLEVYKKALKYYNGEEKHNFGSFSTDSLGICLVLPCILWELDNYLKNHPVTGYFWDWHDTSTAFPELSRKNILGIMAKNHEQKDSYRKKLLTKWINKLTKD